jgi:tmRNA-binding protein
MRFFLLRWSSAFCSCVFFMKLRRAKGRRHVDVPFYLFKKKSQIKCDRSLVKKKKHKDTRARAQDECVEI